MTDSQGRLEAFAATAQNLGSLPRSSDKPVKVYEAGRRCVSCNCRISIYSAEIVCAPCEPKHRRVAA